MGKFDDKNTVRERDSSEHDDAHQRHDIKCCAPEQERDDNACDPRRQREENDERIEEGTELRHEDEIKQQDR